MRRSCDVVLPLAPAAAAITAMRQRAGQRVHLSMLPNERKIFKKTVLSKNEVGSSYVTFIYFHNRGCC